jgi:hypothetical protein
MFGAGTFADTPFASAPTNSYFATLAAATSPRASANKQTAFPLSAASAPIAALRRQASIPLLARATQHTSLSRTIFYIVSASTHPAASILYRLSRALAASTRPTALLKRQTGRTLFARAPGAASLRRMAEKVLLARSVKYADSGSGAFASEPNAAQPFAGGGGPPVIVGPATLTRTTLFKIHASTHPIARLLRGVVMLAITRPIASLSPWKPDIDNRFVTTSPEQGLTTTLEEP